MENKKEKKEPKGMKDVFNGIRESYNHSSYGTLDGLKKMLEERQGMQQPKSTETPKGYADGGEIPPGLQSLMMIQQASGEGMPPMAQQPPAPPPMPPMMPPAAPAPQVPDIKTILQQAQSTPPTDYNLFKDITADDRANLYKQLAQRQASPASAAISGIAGLGDAISRSFGGQNTSYQKDVMANQNQRDANQLGAMDIQRKQRVEDIQAPVDAQMNDANSPLAKSMKQILQANGMQVPSQMPPAVMLKVLGPMGEFAMKQAQMDMQKNMQQQTIDIAKAGQKTKEEGQAFDADKEAAKHWLTHPKNAMAAGKRLSEGSAAPSDMKGNGWTIKKRS